MNVVTNNTIAYICNNLENADKYRVEGDKCYYDDEFIGTVETKLEDGMFNVYFTPIKTLEYVELNITIDKTGKFLSNGKTNN